MLLNLLIEFCRSDMCPGYTQEPLFSKSEPAVTQVSLHCRLGSLKIYPPNSNIQFCASGRAPPSIRMKNGLKRISSSAVLLVLPQFTPVIGTIPSIPIPEANLGLELTIQFKFQSGNCCQYNQQKFHSLSWNWGILKTNSTELQLKYGILNWTQYFSTDWFTPPMHTGFAQGVLVDGMNLH